MSLTNDTAIIFINKHKITIQNHFKISRTQTCYIVHFKIFNINNLTHDDPIPEKNIFEWLEKEKKTQQT